MLLMEGIASRVMYWGFDENGNTDETLEETAGGFIFRGKVYTDTAVPGKWKKLKARLTDKQAVQDVIEEAAYTWFNRLMAIKILEKNGYIPPHLEYEEGRRSPVMLQNALRGETELKQELYKELLREYLRDDKDEEALGLLLIRFSHNQPLLHEVFGRIDDYTQILLPQNLLQPEGVLDLINSNFISDEDYKEVELIGWLYQFYISDRKDEVFKGFKKNQKARAQDIPAATQIFTPKWIVKYMVENTLGKTYLDLELDSELKSEMKYLVENEDQEKTNPIIEDLTELSLLDPASGSGHILVYGFELLFRMYKEEGYSSKIATITILENNLYGLDIDERAMQLGRFAVLLTAAKQYPEILSPIDRNQNIILPHIYAFPEAIDFANEELQTFLEDQHKHIAELKESLVLLKQGKNIGAALVFDLSEEARAGISNQFQNWKQREQQLDFNEQLIWERIKPFLEVLLVMRRKFTAVVANPPYMGQKSMNPELKNYINSHYPRSKSDLFAVFIEAMLNMARPNARMGCITMESWMFLSSYEKLRKELLENYSIVSLAHFGWHIIGIAFGTAAMILEKSKRIKLGEYSYLTIEGIDRKNNSPFVFPLKDNGRFARIPQTNFEKIPGSPIAYWIHPKLIEAFMSFPKASTRGKGKQGIATGDNNLFLRHWSEISIKSFSINGEKNKWYPYRKGGPNRKWYGNYSLVVDWENEGEAIKNNKVNGKLKSRPQNLDYAFKKGITWSLTNAGKFSMRFAPEYSLFDVNGMTFFPHIEEDIYKYLALYNSSVVDLFLKIINPTMAFQSGDIESVPVAIPQNAQIEKMSRDNVDLAKKDWDSREISWDFGYNPLLRDSSSLSNALKEWKLESKGRFFELHQNQEELNHLFLGAYDLEGELFPEVPLKEITFLQEELDRKALEKLEPEFRSKGAAAIELPIKKDEVISQFLSYLVGVMLGRYRMDRPGLNIAHPDPTEEELAAYTHNGQTIRIDEDAILPLVGKEGAFPDDALNQTKELLLAIWGEDTLTENINFIQNALGMDLDKWLTEKFWKYHTGMYTQKPIYWLFASNPKKPEKSAFRVLVYMHRMNRFTVQQIQRNYLYPQQEHINRKLERLKEREASLNREEQKELEKLQQWVLELRDYNEVLKELANQQISFDLDDGVSVNYAKFEGAVATI